MLPSNITVSHHAAVIAVDHCVPQPIIHQRLLVMSVKELTDAPVQGILGRPMGHLALAGYMEHRDTLCREILVTRDAAIHNFAVYHPLKWKMNKGTARMEHILTTIEQEAEPSPQHSGTKKERTLITMEQDMEPSPLI